MNDTKHIPLNDEEKAASREVIQELVTDCTGLITCVLASADGFVVAEVSQRESQGERLAAMSSSMVGLAAAISKELSFGQLDTLILESENGKVIVLSAPTVKQDLVLLASCNADATIGQILYNAKMSVKRVTELVKQ